MTPPVSPEISPAAGTSEPHDLRAMTTRFVDMTALSALMLKLGTSHFLHELADAMRADFLRWSDFDKSARLASHSQAGVIELMPVSDAQAYAFKYVNGHPGNTAHGLPTVMAFGVLAEVATGFPVLLSELTLTTALRTAAMSALAAKALARVDARRMALIGNGAQAEFQALAFHAMLGVDELRVYDIDPGATDKLVNNLSTFAGLRVVRAASVAEAVRGADIVTTLTARKARGDGHRTGRGRARHAHQRGGRGLPGQDRTACRRAARRERLRRIRAPDTDRGRDPAARGRIPGDGVVARIRRHRSRPAERRRSHGLRLGGFRAGRLFRASA